MALIDQMPLLQSLSPGEWAALIGLDLGHVLPPELAVALAELESHGGRREDSVGFPRKEMEHGYQKRVDECWIEKRTDEKA